MVPVFQSLHASAARVCLLSYDTFIRRWRGCCKYNCSQYLNSIVLLTSKLGVRYLALPAGGTNNQFHRTAESVIRQGLCLELKIVSGNLSDPGPCEYVVDKIALGQILLRPLGCIPLRFYKYCILIYLDRENI